ncbi:short-chain dehydrogenase/reductase [Lysobacter xinjiangensis]|uniref:Short-chain dehydrogenase/reductase n=1 Tax=Cognatilysobacter xinjiangensis TaxID=546892 RepID=A0ABQ3BUG8_9GAMM|nr:SDR family oxidoreductase [Lysobacter xinjiangensis]GGZ58024.1 short-chain dehydrogenase/reductase [Lysobacter xinjiangensis]
MDLDLTGRHALVCGASEGIGRAAALELAAMGADVTVLARRAEALQDVVAALPVRGAQAHGWIAADVSQLDALDAQVRGLVAGKPVHVLVNNTGGPPGGPAHTAPLDAYRDAFARHLLANQVLVQAVVGGMQAANWGRIVNVVSTSVREPIANLGVSNTVRGAVASWAKTISRELAGHGITVNNVLPGYTKTSRLAQILADRAKAGGQSEDEVAASMLRTVPAGRFAEAKEVAAVIAFLCSPAAAYVNGVSLAVDGGRMQSI